MIYPIVCYGIAVLRQKAVDIKKGEIDTKKLADDMFETMYEANGVGLAAPQIGKSIRFFVVDGEQLDPENLKGFKKVFINAQIVERSGDKTHYDEGCLSIPGVRGDVIRYDKILISYFDENWEKHEETFSGIASRIIQHEYDHIEGILFTDLVSPLKKQLIKGKLIQITKGNVKMDYKMTFAR